MDFLINFLFLIVFFDARLLRRQEEPLYERTLKYREWAWAVLFLSCVFIIGIFIGLEEKGLATEDHALLGVLVYLIALLGYYLILRRQFQRGYKPNYEEAAGDSGLFKNSLLSDGLGVLLFTFWASACFELMIFVANKFFTVFNNELERTMTVTAFYLFLMVFFI